MSKTKTTVFKEASRLKKTPENMIKGYCQRTDCSEWASYRVIDKNGDNRGGYCSRDSEFLVRALNNSSVNVIDTASFFPPL